MGIRGRLFIWVFLFVFGLLGLNKAYSQKPFNYSQYMHNLGPINPTWYLSDVSSSIHGTVRKQWIGLAGAPTTYSINGHIPLPSIQSTVGMNVSFDSFGPERFMDLRTFLGKSIQLSQNEKYLSASLSIGISRYEVLYSKLDALDPLFKNDILETAATIGLGIMFYEPERFFVGFSIPRFSMQELGMTSNKNDYYFNATYYLMAGYLTKINDAFKIKPVVLASKTTALLNTFDISTTLYVQDALGFGLSYGTSKELGAHVSIYTSDQLRFGYNYQFSTKAFGGLNIGNDVHEIGISYRFGKGKIMRKLL